MSGPQALRAVEELAVADKALVGTLLFVALRVARTSAWRGQGFKTAADWLAATVGISVSEAKRQLTTAARAEDLPKTKEAMKNGDISPDQAEPVVQAPLPAEVVALGLAIGTTKESDSPEEIPRIADTTR